ncbi:MAG: LptF/LptG family permease [Chloracidobacterium sp.]|nr:LptF/LptG family permease [Chloracidobacterium sp.]MDW8216496.1 LptF/LptG family permease [Acidobacteriota bacterium]
MRLFDRYLIREIIPYTATVFFLLTAVIFVHEAGRFSELFVVFGRRGLSSAPLIVLVFSLLPGIVIFTLPIAFLIGVMMAMGRLSGDSEIVALQAGGAGPWALLRPALLVGAVVTVVTGYNTFYLLPVAVNSLNQLKKTRSELLLRSIETYIKPGAFTEDLPGKILYVDRSDGEGGWRRIFIAEAADRPNQEPKIYSAESGRLVVGKTLQDSELRLEKARVYSQEARQPDDDASYFMNASGQLTASFSLGRGDEAGSDLQARPPGPELLTFPALWAFKPADAAQARAAATEIHKRIALPAACLIFALFGVVLGVRKLRSGRSGGLFVGMILAMVFYLLLLGGERSARSGAAPVMLAVWLPNLLFLGLAVGLLSGFGAWAAQRLNRGWFWCGWNRLRRLAQHLRRLAAGSEPTSLTRPATVSVASPRRRLGFPRILDGLIFRDAVHYFLLVLFGLVGVFHVFTLFELINSIVQNRIGLGVVVGYLLFLTPQVVNYMTPFAVLVATLVTFGLLARTSQLVVLYASGQSLYRLSVPLALGAALAAATMATTQELVLPASIQRQDYLRYQIRGGTLPPQTFHQKNRKWFRGRDHRIFNFAIFDTDRNEFASFSIYELHPTTAMLLSRTYAAKARWDPMTEEWVLTNGWRRTFSADGLATSRRPIQEMRLKLSETPDYFKQSTTDITKMSVVQLRQQIAELTAQGLDVENLERAVQTKIAAPLACFVMVLVGIPFALTVGKRGAMVGVAVGVGLAVLFWGTVGLFEQLGHYRLLPAFWAAWGPNLLFGSGGLYLLLSAKT